MRRGPVACSSARRAEPVTPPTRIETCADLRSRLDADRAAGRSVGFVPTMGYLHDGHASLMRAARAETDVVVASIFVNPLQFAPGEDLADYPRDLDRDTELAAQAGVDLLFTPAVDEMYPRPVATEVAVPDLARLWEGATRPTHFTGVATVVSKLFNIVGACRAYFGEKDYQQLQVIRRMASDLSMPVDVVGCPIVREPDGLAMSSRNVYMDPDERAAATVLRRALDAALRAIADGQRDSEAVCGVMREVIGAEPLADLDYAALVDAESLEPLDRVAGEVRLLVAARVGPPRLIDNDGTVVDD